MHVASMRKPTRALIKNGRELLPSNTIFARNLLDEDYLLDAGNTGGAFGIPSYIPAEPLLYGVKVGMKF